MPDSRRQEMPRASEVNRDTQAEALLVAGLDQYFAGQYEEAIHLWTRVLFLDRSHARARAYIDRARTALAERQRVAEEMLEASRELLAQGQTDAARHLLTEAVARSGEDEQASAIRVKLDRLEQLARLHTAPAGPGPQKPLATPPVPGWQWPRRSRALAVVIAAGAGALLLLGVVIGINSPTVRDWVGLRSPGDRIAPATAPAKRPILSSSDVALIRARNLYARGRLAEALQALDRVSAGGPVRIEADDLRIQIQQLLLAGGLDRFRTRVDRQ